MALLLLQGRGTAEAIRRRDGQKDEGAEAQEEKGTESVLPERLSLTVVNKGSDSQNGAVQQR